MRLSMPSCRLKLGGCFMPENSERFWEGWRCGLKLGFLLICFLFGENDKIDMEVDSNLVISSF